MEFKAGDRVRISLDKCFGEQDRAARGTVTEVRPMEWNGTPSKEMHAKYPHRYVVEWDEGIGAGVYYVDEIEAAQ